MASRLDNESKTAWISQGFEHLVSRVQNKPGQVHFDVLIIGSGYGGAVSAATFAGRTSRGKAISVAVLERGKEYLPGAFPKGLGELPGHIRQDGKKEGLFDVRSGSEVITLTANGIGGGSLINAGVMEVPLPQVFQFGWPKNLSVFKTWSSYYDRVTEMLGASIETEPNTIIQHVDGIPKKYKSLESMAPTGNFRAAAITVAMDDRVNSSNVELKKCLRCGDCATGCNFGAKDSLDVNLLLRAHQSGADIFSGATVLSVEKEDSYWIVNTVFTNAKLRARHSDNDGDPEIIRIKASKVIIAAGTLGSTEILLRSKNDGLDVASKMLGKNCSTNGDTLVADYDTQEVVNNIASELTKPSERAIGPTITGIIDLRKTSGVLIEEISVPASLRVAFKEVFSTVNKLHELNEIDWSSHIKGFPQNDGNSVQADSIEKTALFAVMGDDGSKGHIELGLNPFKPNRDGTAKIRWDKVQDQSIFKRGVTAISGLTKKTGGRIIPNPVWNLLPDELSGLLKNKKGPVTTVHPLGGLIMADNNSKGVVNSIGQVYTSDTTNTVHDGLVVLDGSIVPTALGTNPALTIAALALRASEKLAKMWFYSDAPAVDDSKPLERPIFRNTDFAVSPKQTEAEVIERLSGPVTLKSKDGTIANYIVELTLRFNPKVIADLSPSNGADCTLQVSTNRDDPQTLSMIRILDKSKWECLEKSWYSLDEREERLTEITLFSAPLTGSLKVLERQKSSAAGRIVRAGSAWFLNRGLRDMYQAFRYGEGGPGIINRIKSGLAIASRAGEIRNLVYNLEIGVPHTDSKISLSGSRIVGTKRFTYERRSNPWRQLMEVTLNEFPGLCKSPFRVLTLDLKYLADIGVPLFRITRENDGVSGISDLLGFFGYFIRLLFGLHIWSFRAPDIDRDKANNNIKFDPPSELKVSTGTVSAEIIEIDNEPEIPDLAIDKEKVKSKVRITRYKNPNTTERPVVMFHGYSAGGTTFAHHAVNPNLASYLWDKGRDVWIADLRTSPAFANTTATQPWSFDQVGHNDVSLIINEAAKASGDRKVDVIAHCLGAIVFSIAILGGRLNKKVANAAFTQVGPLVAFTPINIFRAYILRYLIEFLPSNYHFKPNKTTLADDLLDRVLSTLPYPIDEFDLENPILPWKETPWTRTRHRMDALYGRVFNSANMEPNVLRYIDEHFGAISLKTLSTTIHFARYAMMTNFQGKNDLVSRKNFKFWNFPTFSLHGEENGLSHVSTVSRMEAILRDAGVNYLDPCTIPKMGHQDSLIGTKRQTTFKEIELFLNQKLRTATPVNQSPKKAYPPWIGPIISVQEIAGTPRLVARVGASPTHRVAEAVVILRVQICDGKILRPDNQDLQWDTKYILSHMVVYSSEELQNNNWDAFAVPPRSSMPNYNPAHPGNATLILITYDESMHLGFGLVPISDYFLAKNGNVYTFNPLQTDQQISPSHEIKIKQLKGMSQATFKLINTQGPIKIYDTKEVMREHSENFSFDLMDGIIPDRINIPETSKTTRFTLSSCQYPAGFLDAPLAYRSYKKILEKIQGTQNCAPRFMLFVGDQVYVDPTAGLYDPSSSDDKYRLPYENWLSNKHVRSVLRSIPSFMLPDDHEIADNWEPNTQLENNPHSFETIDKKFENQITRTAGLKSFLKYQRASHPSAGINSELDSFTFDEFPFFLLDTRTNRQHRKIGNLNSAHLFETNQTSNNHTMANLKKWLSKHTGPKFIVSPSMILPRHRRAVQRDTRVSADNLSAIHSDGWDGYPDSMNDVLSYIAHKAIKNVVFLSGDEHCACIATAKFTDKNEKFITQVYSIHTAAMWAPYPFANAINADFIDKETLKISKGKTSYNCDVKVLRPHPAGDGATYLSVYKQEGDWKLDCEFSDGKVHTLNLSEANQS